MAILEKIDKALEFLKNSENSNKIHELQSYAGALGQCMGILGGHPSMVNQYNPLLQQSIPILLSLCTHNSAEIRLVADEALNRIVVGGAPFHSSKVHLFFYKSITSDKHPRWLRAAISRVFLGKTWLRANIGKGRIFAQSTLIRLKDILDRIRDPQLIVEKGDTLLMECLESNLPRIVKAISPFATKDEMFGLLCNLIKLVDSTTTPIRRNAANCIADICQYHKEKYISHVINLAIGVLQEKNVPENVVLGWFGTLRTVLTINPVNTLKPDIISVVKLMTLYQICLYYIDSTKSNHNILNAVMECLSVILNDASSALKLALLDPKGPVVLPIVKEKRTVRGHHRSLSSVSMAHSLLSTASSTANLSEDILNSEHSDNVFHTSFYGSVSQSQTPYRSIEDLSLKGIHTPDSPCESMVSEFNSEIMTSEQFSVYVKEKLKESNKEDESEEVQSNHLHTDDEHNPEINNKLNIGSFNDADVPLKYCGRLIASRFLLTGYSNRIIPDKISRVSIKASALSCMIPIIELYPEIMTLFLSIQIEPTLHNLSGNSEMSSTSHNEQLNDFVLERNICYQESLTDSFGQELLSKSTDLISQASGTGSNKSGMSHQISNVAQKIEKLKSVDNENTSSLAGVPSNLLDSKQSIANNQMATSGMTDSMNLAMTTSNFTMASQTTASNYPVSTDLLTTSIDPLTSSLDLEMIFDHFGESSMSFDDPTKQTEIEQKNINKFDLEQMFQEMLVTSENINKSIESKQKSSERDLSSLEPNICDIKHQDNFESRVIESETTNQHIADIFFLLENHPDPQIKGLTRICIGEFLYSVCDTTCGEYNRWKPWSSVPKTIVKNMTIANLLEIILKGVTDTTPQCVNHSITALKKCINSFSSCNSRSVVTIFNNLRHVENNSYWLCKVNLCNFYASIDYQRLNILIIDWPTRSWQLLDSLIKLLNDHDQKVRQASVKTIAKLVPYFHSPLNYDTNSSLIHIAMNQNESMLFNTSKRKIKLLSDYKNSQVFPVLPNSLKDLNSDSDNRHFSENDLLYSNLKCIVGKITDNLLLSQCKYVMQGCLETLLSLSLKYPPTKYRDAYCGMGLLEICLQFLEYRTLSVSCCETLLAFLTQIYIVEAWTAISQKHMHRLSVSSLNINILKDQQKIWSQFEVSSFSSKAEQLLKTTLKLLNILIHIILDVTPTYIQQRTSGIMPPSPLRKRTDEAANKVFSTSNSTDLPADDKSKRKSYSTISGHFIPIGYFINDVVLMKLYANLKSAYISHKVSIDAQSSVFFKFLSTTLESLSMQLEIMSEKEAGKVSEEILYYLKCLLPHKPDGTVACVTQLVKCLFSVNMTAQRNNLQTFLNDSSVFKKEALTKPSFYDDILTRNCESLSFESIMNFNEKMFCQLSDSSDNCTNLRIAEGFGKNSHLQFERDCYLSIKNFTKSKTDKEWTMHKQDFAKYIKLLEPIVVQALKGYTIQDNILMQCKVLELMNQLLALRINYCFLNRDRVFVEYVLKQLEFIEHNEILDCEELVRSIFTFLIHLSSAEHHTKQLMDIPKLIQLCDGLMAGEIYNECIQSLHPLVYKVFVMYQQIPGQNRLQIQEAQVTKEVLFSMLQKMMRDTRIVKLISSVLIFSEEHPESHYRWSQLVCDTLFQLLKHKSIDINSTESYVHLDKLLDCIHREVLFDQSKIEVIMKIIFDNPPDQENMPLEVKERWLATILLFLRKIIFNLAENEILLSLNYLKTSCISPASIFFNSQNSIDPLNVQTVNENCANLSPDVIFVRFLFRLLSYALLELEFYDKNELIEPDSKNVVRNLSYWLKLTTSIIYQVKNILYLKEGCRFPLLAKTAQVVLQNEQSGLNTGLYSPDENIPLKRLAAVCSKILWRQPILAVHWCHLLVRLKFMEQKNWGSLLGFLHNSSISIEASQKNIHNDILQIGCFLTLCEYFVDNGLDEVINLTWLLVNRIHYLIQYYNESIVKNFVAKINASASASGLLLQAISARCQPYLKGSYGINVYRILSICHISQSGSLLFCICRFVGRLPLSNAFYFVKLAIKQCRYLASLSIEEANIQITLDDIQMAMEMLHNDRVDKRYPELINEINNLASSLYNLSPLDMPLDRPINPQNIKTTSLDSEWFLNQIKNRCYKCINNTVTYGKNASLAKTLVSFNVDDLNTIFGMSEFDTDIVKQTLKLGTEIYINELTNKVTEQECVKTDRRRVLIEQQITENEGFLNVKDSFMESNIFNITGIPKFKKIKGQSQFFVSVDHSTNNSNTETKKLESLKVDEKSDFALPEFKPLLAVSLKYFQKMLISVNSLFPKNIRPLSQFEMVTLTDYQTMDKYTKRCYIVFRDRYFHDLMLSVQDLVTEYLSCVKLVEKHSKNMDSDNIDKIMDLFMSKSLSHNIMLFSIISLQYTSYLIKQSNDSWHISQDSTYKNDLNNLDHVIDLCVKNSSLALNLRSIWTELNADENNLRIFSAVNCLYNYVTYVTKDTLPLKFNSFVSSNETAEESKEIAITCDKLLTIVQYWQDNCCHLMERQNFISQSVKMSIENLLISLCRCKFSWSFSLLPTCAWEGLQLFEDVKNMTMNELDEPKIINERKLKSDFPIPIDILQDMDILEQFLFRVNLIGWTSKKGFEEIWVSFLGALQGNGTHWAIRGMMQLILLANCNYCSRGDTLANTRIKKLKEISLSCNFYDILFYNKNLETVPYKNCGRYFYSQVSIDYLKYIAGLNEYPDVKIQNALGQSRKMLQSRGIDINSCVQLLMDFTSQVFSQSDWGLGARNTLLCCIINMSDTFTTKMQWQWLAQQLSSMSLSTDSSDILTQQYITIGLAKVHCVLGSDIPDVNQLTACLSSSFAPIRIAAIHAAIMHLSLNEALMLGMEPTMKIAQEQFNSMLDINLLSVIRPHLVPNAVVSLYEQSLCWTALFALIHYGNKELLKIAIDFFFSNPNHFCSDMILRGICRASLAKEGTLENEIKCMIYKALDMNPEVCHRLLPLLLTQIYTSGDIQTPESSLEPEQLLIHLQTFATLQKSATLSPLSHAKDISNALVYYLKDFLPPAAILNKVVQEFIDCCRWSDSFNLDKNVAITKANCGLNLAPFYVELFGNVVFEVFEAAITQDQLAIFNGWLFEGLGHFIEAKFSPNLIPFCLIVLISSASSNKIIRQLAPIICFSLKVGYITDNMVIWSMNMDDQQQSTSVIPKKLYGKSEINKMSFEDMRLLCLAALHSNFTKFQLEKLKSVCVGKASLNDLRLSLEM